MKDHYLKKIKKLKTKYYKNSPIFHKSFLRDYFFSRNLLINKKFKEKESKKKKDKTFLNLKKIKEKKLNLREKQYLMILFKKFEVNLKLKQDYNLKGEKKTNLNTTSLSYLILAKLVYENQLVNKLQFLNFLLKVIDTMALEKKLFINSENKKLFFDLINLEIKLVKHYVK